MEIKSSNVNYSQKIEKDVRKLLKKYYHLTRALECLRVCTADSEMNTYIKYKYSIQARYFFCLRCG